MKSPNPTYLFPFFTASFYVECLAHFLKNVCAQIEKTEAATPTFRRIASCHTCAEQQAREYLREHEELHRDQEENEWFAKRERPNYELDSATRAQRARLLLARGALKDLLQQCKASQDRQPAIELVVSNAELLTVLELLKNLNVDPHKEG